MATIKSELDYIQEARSQLAEALITKFGVRRYDNAKDNPTLKGLWTVKKDGSADKLKRLHDWALLVTGTNVHTDASLTFKSDGKGDAAGTTFNGSIARSISYNSIGAAPAVAGGYLPLSGGTMTGQIKGNNKGGAWIAGRSNAAIYQPRNTENDWHPVIGFKTKTGSWEFGNVGDDLATFSWGSDSNYTAGTNSTTQVYLRNKSGTIALTSEIPTKSSWNYDDIYSKLGHTHATSIATSTDTNQITLAYGGKYKLTAGGTSYVFTMPASDNTWRPIGTGATDAAAGNHVHKNLIIKWGAGDTEGTNLFTYNGGAAKTINLSTPFSQLFTNFSNAGSQTTRITIGGVTKDLKIDADTIDGYHANGLLTALSNSNKGISITVGGTTKSISNISVNYASSAGSASKVYGQVGDTGLHELVRCDMNNDQFRIIAGSNGNNNGWAEIATADDGNEPIYVRQYTGVFSSVKRTLTLLDANGYTHFPSYINIGGNENNNSSPDRVWGSNGSDSYLRSYRTSALRVSYATSAGNADTVDGYHASSLVKFYLSPMTNDAPADSAKSWFVNTMPAGSGAIVYNVPGSEKTIIAGKSTGSFGHILQLSYDDTYLRILRYYSGSWRSTDWEKISAGYADSASKWITARTLTIGSTGKSVDGSGNVSWSLAEIGASSTTHTHSIKINGATKTIAASGGAVIDLGSYLPLSGGTMTLGEGLKFHSDENYFGTNLDARIISLLDGNGTTCDGGLIIDERATYNGTEYITELLRIRDTEFKWKGQNILHAGNSNIKNGVITINGTSITPLTAHQSLANYVTLNTAQTINGVKTFNNNITLNAIDQDRYITFNYTGSTGYDWRIGYLGSGVGDANYFVIQSDKTDGTYVNALRIGLTTLASVFGGTVTSSGFIKSGSSDSYVLLGGGGHKLISDFATSGHNHNSSYVSNVSISGNYLRVTKNGSNSDLTIPYATSADYSKGIINKGNLDSQEKIDNFITANRFEYATFKTTDSNNVEFASNDGMILSIPWGSTTYGTQMAFDDTTSGTVKVRGKSTSWGSWYTLLHSGNYNNYTPTKTGTGASGTWGINITGSAGSVAWGNISGKPTTISGYGITDALNKLTYEYNKEISFGSTGKLLIGKFPCYDSNVTIYLDSTTNTTYHATIILATQNIDTSHGGGINFHVYGDETNQVTPNLYLYYPSNSRYIEIYFSPQAWSKNLIHIKCATLTAAPTNICEKVSEIPSTAITKPINVLNIKASVNYATSAGSIAWANITGKPTTFDPTSHTHTVLTPERFDTNPPAPSHKYGLTFQFSQNLGTGALGWYNVLNMRSYADPNYTSAQIITPADNPGKDTGYSGDMKWRQGRNSTWLDWKTIIDSSNYTNYVNTTNFPGLNKVGTVTSVTVTGSNGLSGTGTITTSGTITLSNAGVRSTTINGNYLRVNTNGTNADLTINYATTASQINNTSISDPNTAASDQNVKWYSQISQSSGYAGTNYGFPVSNNANGILWLGTHSGPYGWQMGFSSNGRIYARYISNNSFSTSANGSSWNRIAWTSDIPTKISQLTNDSGYVTSSGVTSVATGTGLTGGTITSTGTISINSTYQTYISHGESAYNSLSNYYPVLNSTGKWSASGGGKNAYCLIAEIDTNASYINYPITFEIGGRGTITSKVTIRFNNQLNTDPDCNLFVTDQDSCYYLHKATTNTWRLYASSPFDSSWGTWYVYRIFGGNANRVTMKMETVSSLPSEYRTVTYTGNVEYATTSGSVAWDNITGKPFNWSGQSGQPSWLWGSNDGVNMYVWNPSNFSVNYANLAGSANSVAWGNVTGKPSTFTPSSHTHSYLSLAGGDMNSGARISASGDNLYLGNSNNAAWVVVQDMCSQNGIGDGYWSLRADGTFHSKVAIISGNITSGGYIYATHFYESSDIRYKKILRNLLIDSNTIANLPLFDFEWIENNSIGTGTSAQAVQEILPYIVSGTDKLTLDYGVLGTVAGITACKELVRHQSEIEELKQKNKELELEVKLLKSMIYEK